MSFHERLDHLLAQCCNTLQTRSRATLCVPSSGMVVCLFGLTRDRRRNWTLWEDTLRNPTLPNEALFCTNNTDTWILQSWLTVWVNESEQMSIQLAADSKGRCWCARCSWQSPEPEDMNQELKKEKKKRKLLIIKRIKFLVNSALMNFYELHRITR